MLDHKSFLIGDKEIASMGHWVWLWWCRYALGASGVEMRVKVDDRDGTIEFVEGTKDGKDDCMVATESVWVVGCTSVT